MPETCSVVSCCCLYTVHTQFQGFSVYKQFCEICSNSRLLVVRLFP